MIKLIKISEDEKMIDLLDSKIIRFLQQDGRMPYSRIAQELGVTEPTVRTRVQKLIREGSIQIVAMGDPAKLGFNLTGTMKVEVDFRNLQPILAELKKMNEVWYISMLTGPKDLELRFNVKSMMDLKDFTLRVNTLEGVINTETSLVVGIEMMKYEWGTALDQES